MDEMEQLQALIDGADEILGIKPDTKADAEDGEQKPDAELDGDTEGEADGEDAEESEEEESVDGEYVPTYTYKIKDTELEFDDRVKSIIKTKEDEAFVRDLYTKAGGLDTYKEKVGKIESVVSELESELSEVAEAKEGLQTFIESLIEMRDGGNVRKMFEQLGLDEDAVLREAISIAKERELPENERVALASKRKYEAEVEKMKLNEQASKTQQQKDREAAEQAVMQKQLTEFDELTSGEFKEFADALKSNSIDLFEEVAIAGRKIVANEARVPTMAEAITAVQNKYKGLMATNTKQKEEVKKVVKKKEAVPAVKSGGSTPVAQQVSSLEDLQKAYNSL